MRPRARRVLLGVRGHGAVEALLRGHLVKEEPRAAGSDGLSKVAQVGASSADTLVAVDEGDVAAKRRSVTEVARQRDLALAELQPEEALRVPRLCGTDSRWHRLRPARSLEAPLSAGPSLRLPRVSAGLGQSAAWAALVWPPILGVLSNQLVPHLELIGRGLRREVAQVKADKSRLGRGLE